MIILTNTTDKIQVKLGATVATNQATCYASYRDTTSSTIAASRNALSTNNITAVDLVDSPAASTQRIVDYLSVYNADTAAITVTIQFNDNGTVYPLCVVTIAANEKVEYQESSGFRILSTTGAVRVASNAGAPTNASALNFVLKSTDQTSSADAFADISGLSFSVTSGRTYWFKFVIPYTATNTSTGIRLAINGPSGTPPALYYTTTVAAGLTSIFSNRGITTYDGTTTSATSANASGNIGIIEGIITAPSTGTVIARFSREPGVVTSVVQKAGAFVKYLEI